jgi:hypothetical protein
MIPRVFKPIAFVSLIVMLGCSTSLTKLKKKNMTESYVQDQNFPKTIFAYKNLSWVTLSPDEKELYLLQRGVPAVSVWDLNGNLLKTWSTKDLGFPHSLRFQVLPDNSQRIWITDMAPPVTAGLSFGHCLKQFSIDGTYINSIGQCGKNTEGTSLNPVQFDKVTDLGFDSKGNLWVSDGDIGGLNNRVLQLTPQGKVLQAWSAPGDVAGFGKKQFNLPHALEVDSCDRVFIADALNHRIQIVRSDGLFLQELKCFGADGVYGLSVRKSPSGNAQLLITANASSSPTFGTVRVFPVDDNCDALLPVPNQCAPSLAWQIKLPSGTSESMLHAITVTKDHSAIFIALLGGNLPPQKWIRVKSLANLGIP